MPWQQTYNPLNSVALSTTFAALPIGALLGSLAILKIKAHWAALLGLATALVVAIAVFGMPGKMVDAQSIVVAGTATHWYGHEGDILRYVFFHSLALAVLMGCLVFLQAYVPPFTYLVVR